MTETLSRYGNDQSGVAYGRMTKAEILHDVPPLIYRKARRTAHNEYERCERRSVAGDNHISNAFVVRYRLLDIVTVWREGDARYLKLDFGGWHTLSTRRHMMDAARRHGWGLAVGATLPGASWCRVYNTPGAAHGVGYGWDVTGRPLVLKAQGDGPPTLA